MSPSDTQSPAQARTQVSIVGCPGSGAERLQDLVAALPGVVTVPETPPDHTARDHRVDAVLLRRDPGEIFVMDVTRAAHPGSRFVHVVRDPRAVAAFLMASSRQGWGFAPRSALDAAETWAQWAAFCRPVQDLGDAGRTVRCEDVLAGDTLARVLVWLGLRAPEDLDRRVRDALTPGAVKSCLDGYEWSRRGWGHDWRTDLLDAEIADVEGHVWAAMIEFGYEPVVASGPRRASRRKLRRARRCAARLLRDRGHQSP